ncbi:hypothetical protein DFH09DRAFT_1468399, partial [Mycena vulgaris]
SLFFCRLYCPTGITTARTQQGDINSCGTGQCNNIRYIPPNLHSRPATFALSQSLPRTGEAPTQKTRPRGQILKRLPFVPGLIRASVHRLNPLLLDGPDTHEKGLVSLNSHILISWLWKRDVHNDSEAHPIYEAEERLEACDDNEERSVIWGDDARGKGEQRGSDVCFGGTRDFLSFDGWKHPERVRRWQPQPRYQSVHDAATHATTRAGDENSMSASQQI